MSKYEFNKNETNAVSWGFVFCLFFFGGGVIYQHSVLSLTAEQKKRTCLGCTFIQSVYEKKYFQAVISSLCPALRLNPRISQANFGAGDVG